MIFSQDPEVNAAYVRVRSGKIRRTVTIWADSVIADLDGDEQLLGVEILGPGVSDGAGGLMARKFLVSCVLCDPDCISAVTSHTAKDRERWQEEHRRETGHDQWMMRDQWE